MTIEADMTIEAVVSEVKFETTRKPASPSTKPARTALEAAQELRSKISIKSVRNVRRGTEVEEGVEMFREGVKICLERSRLLTEAYKMYEGEPLVLLRAKALDHVLSNMTIFVRDWERIVGNYAAKPDAIFWSIDSNWRSVDRLLQSEAKDLLDESEREELKQLCAYWQGKSVSDRRKDAFAASPDLDKYWRYEGTILWSQWTDAGVAHYEKAIDIGMNGMIAQAQARLEEIGKTLPPDYLEQKDFLEAVIIVLKAAIKWAGRYAKLAHELAAEEKDPVRKKQLEQIAHTCEWVPANPARTFQEALQSFFFVFQVIHQIEYTTFTCGIRLDLATGRFLKEDLAKGRTTREEALDVMLTLWAKMEELGQMYSPTLTSIYGGVQVLQAITIGGVDSEGRDVTNEVSYLALDTAQAMRTIQPSIAMRVHEGTPKELFMKAIDVVRTGVGYPAFYNDSELIPLLLKWNIPFSDARNYSIDGCVYLRVPGKNLARASTGCISFPKCFWWALHQGKDPKTDVQFGAQTADPATFTCLEDVMEAYLKQVRFFHGKIVNLENMSRRVHAKYLPRPFYSAFVDDCIERGKDMRQWGYPSPLAAFTITIGTTNVADSLAAIKKLVFDDKKVSLQELIAAMDRDWEGQEDLRQMCLNAPKFGNNDDYVDLIARDVHHRTEAAMEEAKDLWGNPVRGDGSGVSSTYGLSLDCPATPDGRMDGGYFADADLSPQPGADIKGPTAVLGSCAKIDTLQTYNHLLNQRFMPQLLEGKNKEAFYSYLKSWQELGISHIQFNVQDRETLLDAQIHPEKHRSLVVRIAGYSAYFIDLSKGLQDHIIARVQHAHC